jgi:hypothetical protein
VRMDPRGHETGLPATIISGQLMACHGRAALLASSVCMANGAAGWLEGGAVGV